MVVNWCLQPSMTFFSFEPWLVDRALGHPRNLTRSPLTGSLARNILTFRRDVTCQTVPPMKSLPDCWANPLPSSRSVFGGEQSHTLWILLHNDTKSRHRLFYRGVFHIDISFNVSMYKVQTPPHFHKMGSLEEGIDCPIGLIYIFETHTRSVVEMAVRCVFHCSSADYLPY